MYRTTRFPLTLLCLLALCGYYPAGVRAQDLPPSQIYERTLKGTALVVASDGLGSGWLVSRSGLLVTNHHVVGMAATVSVAFPDVQDGQVIAEKSHYKKQGVRIRGRVLYTDPGHDLALVRLERVPDGAVPLRLSPSLPRPGERVHAVGNPAASDALWVYTEGKVRQVYQKKFRYRTGQEVEAVVVEMQAPINPGDSGGPVVNDRGQLVGVNAASKADAQEISTAISVEEVIAFLESRAARAAEHNNKAAQLYQKGQVREALAEYNRALLIKPDYALALFNRSLAFESLGNADGAKSDRRLAGTIDPQFAKK